MPEALRGFLERFQANGPGPGPGGLSGLDTPTPGPPAGGRQVPGRILRQPGRHRAYKLYVPASSPRADPAAGGDAARLHPAPDDFAAGTRMNLLAGERGFMVLYPAQPATANRARCWNWFKPRGPAARRGRTGHRPSRA